MQQLDAGRLEDLETNLLCFCFTFKSIVWLVFPQKLKLRQTYVHRAMLHSFKEISVRRKK